MIVKILYRECCLSNFILENEFHLQEGISFLILQDHLAKTIKDYITDTTNTGKMGNILQKIMFNEQRKQIWKLTTGIPHFDQHG